MLGILTFFILFLFIQAPAVHAEANLKQDDKGRYCIETADDFIEFVSSKDYQDTNIVLKNDITISNMPEISGGLFKGIFDGSGKTIYFKENNYRSKESVFPLTLNGTIKNVKIDVQTKLIASTVGNSVNILVNSVSGGTLQGISVVGNVTCVFDKFDLDLGEDLKVSACDSFGGDIFTGQGCEVNDCEFSLNYILGSESDPNLVNDIINNSSLSFLFQDSIWEFFSFFSQKNMKVTCRVTKKNAYRCILISKKTKKGDIKNVTIDGFIRNWRCQSK